jgi:class 3 adenylate cyclase/predicted ATPase
MRCAKCGSENPDSKRFCGDCGSALATRAVTPRLSDRPTAPAANLRVEDEQPPEGERKIVTALFADIKGSTELMRDLDPEEARAIIDPALRLMIDAVHRYDGYVVQSTGDGIFALFGAPVAHEDHPQRAVHAALAARDDLRRRGDDLRLQGRAGVEVRIGINTGEVVMRMVQTGGHTEYSPVGHAINLARRMESAAPSGGIVVSDETRRLVEGYFDLRGLGATAVKGVDEPIDVYEVVGVGTLHGHFDLAARRGLTRFVGRESELAQMRRALDLAIGGHGQIVAVMAEAGTGKSRLFHEFKSTIPSSCKVLEAYSVSHGKASAWLPVLELLRGYFGIANTDDASSRRDKVQSLLSTLDATLDDTHPYLFGLLGIVEGPDPLAQMDANIRRQRTLDAIKRILLRESLNQPLVVIFEDLHWIDAQTQALLDLLADSLADTRVLLLVNYRPEYRHEWTNKSCHSQLRLDPLSGANGAAMLAALLGESVELNPLKRLIAERTGGNPFFIEEIVQALFDEDALVRNGTVKVTRSLSQLRLPTTVQGMLAERLDRQPGGHKQLLQTLSVIGRESSLSLLSRVASQADSQLQQMLTDLRAAEFIYEQPSTGGIEYVFKHALTQEVAYNSLLIERRKQLHERAGQALEAIFARQLDDHLTQLAHHYSLSDNTDKAVEYLGRAGQQAMQRAYTDAVSHLSAAVDLLQKLPDSVERANRELQLQLLMGGALSATRGWAAPEVERAFFRARDLCERLGDRPEIFSVVFGLWTVYFIRGELSRALELAEQLLARGRNNITLTLFAEWALGDTQFSLGELRLAMEHLEIALSLYDPEQHSPRIIPGGVDSRINCLSYMGMTLWQLGYPDQAIKACTEAVILAQDLSHPFSLAAAEVFLTIVEQFQRETTPVQEVAERTIALCEEHGLSLWLANAMCMHSWAISEEGRYEEGIARLCEGLAATQLIGNDLVRSYYLSLLAEAYQAAGRVDDGLATLEDALAVVEKNRGPETEIHRLKGELLLKQNSTNIAEARSCFERSIEIARRRNAKSCELRSTMSLARLLASQGRRDEARTMLAAIYNWFTEGFDTADLKDAKALLDRLDSEP